MKVLLYTEGLKFIGNSGLGKAIEHQKAALSANGIDYTTDPADDYDIAHINFYGPVSYAVAVDAHKRGRPVVYHAHSTEEDFRNSFVGSNLVSPLFKKWLIKVYSLGDVIITPSEYSRRLLLGYGLKNIYAVSNGVDTDFFRKNERMGAKFRSRVGILGDTQYLILGMGLYIERKGIVDFIKLAKHFSVHYPEYRFVWLGYSPLAASTKPVRDAFAQAAKLDNIVFTGQVSKSAVKAAMSGANAYIFPTFEETEGIPLLEAFSCCTPCIARDIGAFEEYEAGTVVYKARSLPDFERKIRGVCEGKLPLLTERAHSAALAKDRKVVGRQLAEIYRNLVDKD